MGCLAEVRSRSCLAAAGPTVVRLIISEDYADAAAPASVGVRRARTQKADSSGSPIAQIFIPEIAPLPPAFALLLI